MGAKQVGAISDEERQALELEYREHAGWLRSTARRHTGSSDAADDLVQAAFERAARYPSEKRNTRPLLHRILRNLIKDRFRSKSREAKGLAAFLDLGATVIADADQAETLLLRDIIVSMPKPLRDVFVLARFTPLSRPEIALRLGISGKTVEWRLARALEYCVRRLAE
ncbi:RNA polymerase sigma factor [Sphingomonas koreensis]|uniref:RNA polymerase sigma factor n=1 Tax=Sphingomonas koreensis TaxID=93064 RepID=UPI0013E09323|nr:RNA polymerase sigma factor [Sphingomonas koreensis]